MEGKKNNSNVLRGWPIWLQLKKFKAISLGLLSGSSFLIVLTQQHWPVLSFSETSVAMLLAPSNLAPRMSFKALPRSLT